MSKKKKSSRMDLYGVAAGSRENAVRGRVPSTPSALQLARGDDPIAALRQRIRDTRDGNRNFAMAESAALLKTRPGLVRGRPGTGRSRH